MLWDARLERFQNARAARVAPSHLVHSNSRGRPEVRDNVMFDSFRAPTQVFIVRIWYEAPDADERELRIQTRHVLTGETRYFLAWPVLIAYLVGKLDAASPTPDE